MAKKKSNPVSRYLSKIGQKGGKAGKGAAKARSSEQARAAVNKRWAKQRESSMEKDPSYKRDVIPVWFSKGCRDALKRARKVSVGDAESMIQRLLDSLGIRDLWNHFGVIKRGDKTHFVTMSGPGFYIEREKVLEFAHLIGVVVVSEDGQRGFWSPNCYYYEFAPL